MTPILRSKSGSHNHQQYGKDDVGTKNKTYLCEKYFKELNKSLKYSID
jgi:hypothetical protein